MQNYSQYYKARDIIEEFMVKDLIGPVAEDEVLDETPLNYYLMGKLYPQADIESDAITKEEGDINRNAILENELDGYDTSISLSNVRNPSSMGITCAINSEVREITIYGSYAFYVPVQAENNTSTGIKKLKKHAATSWQRKETAFSENLIFTAAKSYIFSLPGKISLKVYIHDTNISDEIILTATLVNENSADADIDTIAAGCVFQVQLNITGKGQVFNPINQQICLADDTDSLELEMLYSDIKYYAQGHGCSVKWQENAEGDLIISSAWMPEYELLQMMPGMLKNEDALSMEYLVSESDGSVIQALNNFLLKYSQWINEQENKICLLNPKFHEVAEQNLQKCNAAYKQMSKAVDMLKLDKHAMQAFKIANEAMLLQREQTLKKSGIRVHRSEITWYPFQLAFVLHELPSFICPGDDSRKMVDLLWFPTGGGKTEAYLGIAAFVIFLRRIRNHNDDGTTIIMRYTLRLLTIQQFERASALICACEKLRKKYNIDGSRITIGLWVGGQLTPNKIADARRALNNLAVGQLPGNDTDPCQVKKCPWCGQNLTYKDYCIDTESNQMNIKCPNSECDFHNDDNLLPLNIIDESIYSNPPTFIVATVDKFAQLPLNDKPAALFGISNHKNPPDLIIQDELHLISGPLGTITGIYEAIITKLCEKDGIGAKVIASTATIRNAAKQIKALYGKDFIQFPPQGLTVKDSFFAVESTADKRPARKYLGVLGSGTTATTTLIRVNAALLFATRYLTRQGFEDKVIDNFWTITGYFNSLRELGGANTQIIDDVQSRFEYLAKNKFKSYALPADMIKRYTNIKELTSRLDNNDITKLIQDTLKTGYSSNADGRYVLDFILASNMISVGIDIDRLGTMVMVGQPKTNAEYIQSSSRVGRANPGLVVTVYNQARSRDRSHYEQFIKYHSAMYRYVEATSLTPFADRARDRALHALYVALYRYLVPGKLENKQAAKFEEAGAQQVEKIIRDYVELIDPAELNSVLDELQEIRREWDKKCDGELVYKKHGEERGTSLLKSDVDCDRFATMNSMRNVDVQTGIYLLGED